MNPIRIAITGSRGHQVHVFRDLLARRVEPGRPQGELVAIAKGGDDDAMLADWAREQGIAVDRFDDHVEMLDRVRPDLSVVVGPFERHAQQTIDAIERGIPVLTEKPAALNHAELRRLCDCVAAHPHVHLAGMMFLRYVPGFFEAERMIASGAIGDVRLINVRKSYKLGQRAPHYFDRATYGGTIPWIGSHAFDWAIAFARARPTRVYATHSAGANRGFGTMETSASAVLEFPNGVSASISVDVLRPDNADTHGDDWARVVGSAGVLQIRPDSIDVVDASGTRTLRPAPTGRSPVADLLDAIALGTPMAVDAKSTLLLTQVVLDARRSADERRVVEIDR